LQGIQQWPNYDPTELTTFRPFNKISSIFFWQKRTKKRVFTITDDPQKVIFTENHSRLTKTLDPLIVQNMKMLLIKIVLLPARFIVELFWKKNKNTN
jgi:hypothetical protein